MVVGDAIPPNRLVARARRTVHVTPGEPLITLIADLRSHIPRRVGVLGRGDEAAPVAGSSTSGACRWCCTPTTTSPSTDVPTQRVSDAGEPMDVADDLVALIGNTPMVRLDRTARDLDCHLLAKLELYNPGFSSKDRPALLMIESAEARRPAAARRHDRRADQRQHRRRASPSSRPAAATSASSSAPTRWRPTRSPSCAPTAPR